MKIAIRYCSRTGNTEKLAKAIAEALDTPAEKVTVPLPEPVDILFLCSAVYGAGVDNQVKHFISTLSPQQVEKVVNVSTAALLPSTYPQIAKLLAAQGIALDAREFHCRGKFAVMHSSRPNQQDLAAAREFAKSIIRTGE